MWNTDVYSLYYCKLYGAETQQPMNYLTAVLLKAGLVALFLTRGISRNKSKPHFHKVTGNLRANEINSLVSCTSRPGAWLYLDKQIHGYSFYHVYVKMMCLHPRDCDFVFSFLQYLFFLPSTISYVVKIFIQGIMFTRE